ncbi:complex I NDUFA9 subunit family protein [Halococcoides cellulosivorans]|uniref:Complex I NDUFA9 subunit family protein n=1 Tax=Halococcoides cellulosivorans TaxID=1679096 RepID=A0A2R4X193_9EURY|nr:complex I NDUFA9 subunit family protein [Halococcoides cellulosivorans]AWB27567.1 complex I NDUFA9 subunit family protein [Halococcoides cellulosivorans]
MNVLVAGGDGFIGRHLCTVLAERGHDVAALARDPDPSVLSDGVETVAADVTDPSSVEPATEGRDAVVNLVALSPLRTPRGGATAHERIHVGGTETLLAAAAAADVDRFVQMSALGADPDGATAYLRAKGRAETAVRESDRDWVIVRPSVVFGAGGEFLAFTKRITPPGIAPLPGGGRMQFQPIWVEDLAPILADCVLDDDRAGETYEIGGPERLSLAALARLLRRTHVVPIPMALAKIGLSIADAVPGAPMGLDQYRSLQSDNVTRDNDIAAFDLEPGELTTVEAYLDRR